MSDNEKLPEAELDEKTYKERLDICKTCPDRVGKMMMTSRCGLCGCPIVTKAALSVWHCPAKKW